MDFKRTISEILIGAMTFLPACSIKDRVPPVIPEQPAPKLEKLVLNEGQNVRLGDTFFVYPYPETLKYTENDSETRTLKFEKPGTTFTRGCTYQMDGSANLLIGGMVRIIKVQSDKSLEIDLDTDGTVSKNDSFSNFFLRDRLLVDTKNYMNPGSYFIMKTENGFIPFLHGSIFDNGNTKDLNLRNCNTDVVDTYTFTDNNGKFEREIEIGGVKVQAEIDYLNRLKISSFDGKDLESHIEEKVIFNEGKRIKPGEHFLLDTTSAMSFKGEVWKYLGKDPDAESALNFRKYSQTGFEYRDITIDINGEGMIHTDGQSYNVELHSNGNLSIDLDKSGATSLNETSLTHKLVFNEARDVKTGEVFIAESYTTTDEFHTAVKLSYIDIPNSKIGVYNTNTKTLSEHLYSSNGEGSANIVGTSHKFKVTGLDAIEIDMNGDGKIE